MRELEMSSKKTSWKYKYIPSSTFSQDNNFIKINNKKIKNLHKTFKQNINYTKWHFTIGI